MARESHRVLVVDDSADTLEMYSAVLERAGYAVHACDSADEALEEAERWRPQVVLTDISMPGKSGLELIADIHDHLAAPLPAIAVLSGFSDFEQQALDRGAAAFELKPIGAEGLLLLVDNLRARRRPSRLIRKETLDRRAAITELAERELERALDENPGLRETASNTTRLLARYFDASGVLITLSRDGAPYVFASSTRGNGEAPRNERLLHYCMEVLQTGSSLYLPDTSALAFLGPDDARSTRLLASAALHTPRGALVGSVTVVDEQETLFSAADLTLLEHIARRGNDVLFGSGPRVRAAQRVVRRDTWRVFANRELERLEPDGALCLALIETAPDESAEQTGLLIDRAIPFDLLSSRMLLGHAGSDVICGFKRADRAEEARTAMAKIANVLTDLGLLRHGALLTLSGIAAVHNLDSLLDVTTALLDTVRRREAGQIATGELSPQIRALD